MNKKNILLTFIIFVIFISINLSVEAEQTQQKFSTLKGTVRNLTSNYPVPAQKVTLRIYHNAELDGEKQTMTDTAGKYIFPDLNVRGEWTYQLHTKYKDVDYVSRRIKLAGFEEEDIYNLNVYSISSDDSKVFVEAYHILLDIVEKKLSVSATEEKSKEWLEVTEYLIIENTSNTSYLGEEPMPKSFYGNVGLKLELPEGYKELEIIRGLSPYDLLLKPDCIFHGQAIQPGTLTVAFKYLMPISGTNDLSRRLLFDTEKLLVILNNPRIYIESELEEIKKESEKEPKTFLGETYKKGEQINLAVRAVPPESHLKEIGIYFVISLLIIGLGFGGYFGYKKFVIERHDIVKKAQDFDKTPASEEEEYLLDQKAVYLEFIMILDEMKATGKINDRAYNLISEETEEKLRYVFTQLEE